MADESYRMLAKGEFDFAQAKTAPADLYVLMPTTQKYLLFVQAGEDLSEERRQKLIKLQGQNLYAAVQRNPPKEPSSVEAEPLDESYSRGMLSTAAEDSLRESFAGLLESSPGATQKATERVNAMADGILKKVAPEINNIRSSLLQSLKNLSLMNDIAAISSLAILVAVANDFKSQTALKNLCLAVVLMDAAFAELSAKEVETYYRNRDELPQHVKEKVRLHPLKSQQMVAKLPNLNDTISQLILLHHELNNGKGYHRGIRTHSVLGLARVLSLAVDMFEYLKGAELNGQKLDMRELLDLLYERGVDPHLRRHSQRLIDNIYAFLNIARK